LVGLGVNYGLRAASKKSKKINEVKRSMDKYLSFGKRKVISLVAVVAAVVATVIPAYIIHFKYPIATGIIIGVVLGMIDFFVVSIEKKPVVEIRVKILGGLLISSVFTLTCLVIIVFMSLTFPDMLYSRFGISVIMALVVFLIGTELFFSRILKKAVSIRFDSSDMEIITLGISLQRKVHKLEYAEVKKIREYYNRDILLTGSNKRYIIDSNSMIDEQLETRFPNAEIQYKKRKND